MINLASRRYRSKSSLNSNLADLNSKVSKISKRPSPTKIAQNSITNVSIGEGVIISENLADSSVTKEKIAPSAVVTAGIASSSVTREKLDSSLLNEFEVNALIANSIYAANADTANTLLINEYGGNIELGDSSSIISGSGRLSIGNVGPLNTSFITAASGWALSGTQTYQERNGIAMISTGFERTGAAISVPANGNIVNSTLATLGVGYRPLTEAVAGTGPSGPVAAAYINTSGSIILAAVSGGTTIPTGFQLDINSIFIVA